MPVRRFFNTSGQLYRSLGLKDMLICMSEDECLKLLATDGMLVKRPLLVDEKAANGDSLSVYFSEFCTLLYLKPRESL